MRIFIPFLLPILGLARVIPLNRSNLIPLSMKIRLCQLDPTLRLCQRDIAMQSAPKSDVSYNKWLLCDSRPYIPLCQFRPKELNDDNGDFPKSRTEDQSIALPVTGKLPALVDDQRSSAVSALETNRSRDIVFIEPVKQTAKPRDTEENVESAETEEESESDEKNNQPFAMDPAMFSVKA